MLTADIYNISVMMDKIRIIVKKITDTFWARSKGRGSKSLILLVVAGLMAGAGCTEQGPQRNRSPLLQVGHSVLTTREFKIAMEFTLSGYGDFEQELPKDVNAIRQRVLAQLTEELLWREHARQEGVTVSLAEIEQAVNAIKADYPADEFEKIFAETAVAYGEWENRLSHSLLVRKITQQALAQRISVSAEEVQAFARQQYQKDRAHGEPAPQTLTADQPYFQAIVKRLRQAKRAQAYESLLTDLKQRYTMEFNQAAWEALLADAQG